MYLKNVKKKNKFLIKLSSLLAKNKYKMILFNRTLLCVSTLSMLSHDDYDDVLVDKSILQNKKLLKKISPLKKIKINKNNITIYYNKFRLNIFLIDYKSNYFKFNGYEFKMKIIRPIKKTKILNNYFFTPKYDSLVLKKIFFPNKVEIITSSLCRGNFFVKFKNFFICMIYTFLFSRNFSNYELNQKILELYNLNIFQLVNATIKKFKKKKISKLNLYEFKKMKFDPIDFNCYFRKQHYGLITNNNRFSRINDILNFIKKKNFKSIMKKIVETNTSTAFDEPIYLNKKFWKNGNNFYIYPLIFGFKKNVIGYEKVNEYIKLNKKPKAYTKLYYKKLTNMSSAEIKELMIQKPIAINNEGFLGGRHRVAAMIGRIIKGEAYIPFYVYKEGAR